MEGDTIRISGQDTLIDLWLVDRVRPIRVTREAIAACVGGNVADVMDEAERCEFVRSRLPLVMKAALLGLDTGSLDGDSVVVDGSALLADATMGERRKNDRRRAERRRVSRPGKDLPKGERRKSDRRRDDRRGSSSHPAGPGLN